MISPLVIDNLISPELVEYLRKYLKEATWENGAKTAGHIAATVKDNLQAADNQLTRDLRERVVFGLRDHPLFMAYVQPSIIGILFSRYDAPTGRYGTHVDSAYMGNGPDRIRRDISFTIGLSKHDEYDGGMLQIDGTSDTTHYRPGLGAAVIYPATSLHEVTPVTRGSRLVVVGWARSYVRNAEQRELLFELETAKLTLFEQHGKTTAVDLISKCSANLQRMWMED